MEQLAGQAEVLRGRRLEWSQLFGGLAHVTYAVTTSIRCDRYVVKFLTQEMDDFGLMIPIDDLIANTVAAGRVRRRRPGAPGAPGGPVDHPGVHRRPDAGHPRPVPAPDYIPRIGRAIRDLHTKAPPMRNTT